MNVTEMRLEIVARLRRLPGKPPRDLVEELDGWMELANRTLFSQEKEASALTHALKTVSEIETAAGTAARP